MTNYTRAYANGRFFRLYRGYKYKTWRDGQPHRMRLWEMGVGRWTLTVGRWEA